MRKIYAVSGLVIAVALSGCAQPTLVYPIFKAEDTGRHAVSFEDAYRYEHGIGVPRDYARAIALYRDADRAGDVRATVNLGVMEVQGRGSAVSPSSAFSLFAKAAKAGSANGHYNLGLAYDAGVGKSPDPVAAAYEYRMAAEMGHSAAQRRLAEMLQYGDGVPVDEAEARRLYEMAAVNGDGEAFGKAGGKPPRKGVPVGQAAAALFASESCDCSLAAERDMAVRGIAELRRLADSGDAPARYNLAVRLLKGESSNQDPSEAARLFTLAARQGYAPAQRQLANMHLRGQAVAKSKVIAHEWLNLASRDAGSEGAAARADMEALELSMTVEEIRQAQDLARSGALKGR